MYDPDTGLSTQITCKKTPSLTYKHSYKLSKKTICWSSRKFFNWNKVDVRLYENTHIKPLNISQPNGKCFTKEKNKTMIDIQPIKFNIIQTLQSPDHHQHMPFKQRNENKWELDLANKQIHPTNQSQFDMAKNKSTKKDPIPNKGIKKNKNTKNKKRKMFNQPYSISKWSGHQITQNTVYQT